MNNKKEIKEFLIKAYEELMKYKRGELKRDDACWNVVNLAGYYGLMEKHAELDEELSQILELAMDLEVPDDVYDEGDPYQDTEKLISLIENLIKKLA